jgi:DNA-binding NarL/FixJ family response regulator
VAPIRVVIWSSRTLFAEGIAQRLRQSPELLELHLVDAQPTDALEQVVSAEPSMVLLDATDEETTRQCPLHQLFSALPSLTVVYLDPQQQRMQVVTSAQRSITAFKDLIEVIKGAGEPTST